MTTIPDPLRAAARTRPDAPAILGPGVAWSWADLDARTGAWAASLRARGLGPGDYLAIRRAQDADTLALVLAAWRLDAVAVPISPRVPETGVDRLLGVLQGRDVLVLREDASPDAPVPATRGEAAWQLDRPATVVFTSGSTGVPKAALHTLGHHVWSARGWAERLPLGPADRWLLDLPVAHVGGLAVLVRCVLAGAAVVLPERRAPLAETVARFGVTHVSLVTTQLHRALEGRGDAPPGLRLALLGGSTLPEPLLREARARGWPVCASYGLTEMASTVTSTHPDDPPEALATAGDVLPHRAVRLAADGEVLVRGRTRFAGYLTPEGLETPFDAEGWFATGDLGAWERGRLRIVGRKDNLLVSGGENIHPETVEAVLLAVPGVRQAVVVPVPDPTFGQRPVAFVEAEAWIPEAWRTAVAAALPRFMVPDAFHPWPEEASSGLKPRRADLRSLAEHLARAEVAGREPTDEPSV